MSVNSQQNKELLLQLLSSHPNFNSLKQNIVSDVSNLTNTYNRRNENKSLVEINKIILKIVTQKLNSYISKPPLIPRRNNESKENSFENRLKEHEKNFTQMMRTKKPVEIDFSDPIKDEVIRDVDETLKQREAELKSIMNQYNKKEGNVWISGTQSKEKKENLKIEENSSVPINPIDLKESKPKSQRRVTFNIEEKKTNNPLDSLFNKLKKKSTENDNDLLQRILQNQMLIIKKLNKLENNYSGSN